MLKKMKNIFLFLLIFTVISCSSGQSYTGYSSDQNNLKQHVSKLASTEFGGRKTGEKGQKLAAAYLADYYLNLKLEAPAGHEDYLQHIPLEFFNGKSKDNAENVVAFIKGSKYPDEVLVISSHYDHLGTNGDKIFFGADDDASGNAALMEVARLFQNAKTEGKQPDRSILFLHVSGEEIGLFGSKYYTSHPIFPLQKTIANLNVDMVGRIDDKHKKNPDYVYLIGSDKLSTDLHNLSEKINKETVNLELDYTYNDEKDPNRYYYRSDHYNFAMNNIPVVFYFNGTHEDYHKPTDTEDKINYEALSKRTNLIFYTAWEIVNRKEKIALDSNTKK